MNEQGEVNKLRGSERILSSMIINKGIKRHDDVDREEKKREWRIPSCVFTCPPFWLLRNTNESTRLEKEGWDVRGWRFTVVLMVLRNNFGFQFENFHWKVTLRGAKENFKVKMRCEDESFEVRHLETWNFEVKIETSHYSLTVKKLH